MITIYIIFFMLILTEIIILGILLSKITVKILNLKFYYREKKIYIDNIAIEIDIYLFNIIKLLKLKVYKNYIKIFGLKLYFKNISKIRLFGILRNNNFKNTVNYYIRKINYKNIYLRIQYIDLKVDLGTSNPIITSIAIASISSIFPLFIKDYMKINNTNFKYSIIPNYFNINNYQINLKTCFSFKLYLLISELLNNMNNNIYNNMNNNKKNENTKNYYSL